MYSSIDNVRLKFKREKGVVFTLKTIVIVLTALELVSSRIRCRSLIDWAFIMDIRKKIDRDPDDTHCIGNEWIGNEWKSTSIFLQN